MGLCCTAQFAFTLVLGAWLVVVEKTAVAMSSSVWRTKWEKVDDDEPDGRAQSEMTATDWLQEEDPWKRSSGHSDASRWGGWSANGKGSSRNSSHWGSWSDYNERWRRSSWYGGESRRSGKGAPSRASADEGAWSGDAGQSSQSRSDRDSPKDVVPSYDGEATSLRDYKRRVALYECNTQTAPEARAGKLIENFTGDAWEMTETLTSTTSGAKMGCRSSSAS